MKDSFKIISFLLIGIILSKFFEINVNIFIEIILYMMCLFAGTIISSNKNNFQKINLKMILIPFSTLIGTILSGFFLIIFTKHLKLIEILIISSGFGYYSLASIIVTSKLGIELGTLALLSNVFRELITMIFSRNLNKYLGPLATISSGAATTMDNTLTIIIKNSGKEYALISVFNGLVLTLLAPILINFLLGFK